MYIKTKPPKNPLQLNNVASLTVTSCFNGKRVQGTVDSGATVSIIKTNPYQPKFHCRRKSFYEQWWKLIQHLLGKLTRKCKRNLTGKYGLAYDPERRSLKFGNISFVLSVPDGEARHVILFACEATRIRGSSKQVVNAIMESDFGSCVKLIESAGDLFVACLRDNDKESRSFDVIFSCEKNKYLMWSLGKNAQLIRSTDTVQHRFSKETASKAWEFQQRNQQVLVK